MALQAAVIREDIADHARNMTNALGVSISTDSEQDGSQVGPGRTFDFRRDHGMSEWRTSEHVQGTDAMEGMEDDTEDDSKSRLRSSSIISRIGIDFSF